MPINRQRDEASTETRWHVVGGKLGLYKGERTPKFSDISDKKIWTVLVIEAGQNAAVNWANPAGHISLTQGGRWAIFTIAESIIDALNCQVENLACER